MKVRIAANTLICDECSSELKELIQISPGKSKMVDYYCDTCQKRVSPPYLELEDESMEDGPICA